MEYRTIAEMEVSPVCLGTMTFGSPVNHEDSIRLVHQALDIGINFIDTADMYEGYARQLGTAGGMAEKILGEALKDRRDQAIVTTKAGNPVDGPESTFDISRRHLSRQIDRSLKNLQSDYVDIFDLHRPDGKTPLEESIAAVASFIEQGKTRYWGFSNFEAAQVRDIIAICDRDGHPRPVVSQPHYSWLNREAETEHIPNCREFGISVTPYRMLEGGLLTGKYRRGQAAPEGSRLKDGIWLSQPEDEMFDQLERFEAEASESGCTCIQYALKWVLDQPGVASCIAGVKRIEQLEELIALL